MTRDVEPTIPQLSAALQSSMLWTLAADVIRFHGTRGRVRVVTTRLNSGQYFGLAIASGQTNMVVEFNIPGTRALVGGPHGVSELLAEHGVGAYIPLTLQSGTRALLEHVEAALELGPRPKKPESTTPTKLCIRAIATLMAQRTFWSEPLVADSGGLDEGWGPSIQEFVRFFPEVHARVSDALAGERPGDAMEADRIWLLEQRGTDKQVVLDFETAEAVIPKGRRESLWSIFEKNDRKLAPVVAWLDEQL